MQAAHQNCRLDHCRLRAIESLKRRMGNIAQHATMEPRPLLVLRRLGDGKFGMCKRSIKTRNRYPAASGGWPLIAPGQAAGEYADVIGEICDRERNVAQIVERGRRAEWRNDPAVALRDDADWAK